MGKTYITVSSIENEVKKIVQSDKGQIEIVKNLRIYLEKLDNPKLFYISTPHKKGWKNDIAICALLNNKDLWNNPAFIKLFKDVIREIPEILYGPSQSDEGLKNDTTALIMQLAVNTYDTKLPYNGGEKFNHFDKSVNNLYDFCNSDLGNALLLERIFEKSNEYEILRWIKLERIDIVNLKFLVNYFKTITENTEYLYNELKKLPGKIISKSLIQKYVSEAFRVKKSSKKLG